MESLTCYLDYLQTMSFLRASRNRIINSIETTKLKPESAQECKQLCKKMYDTHVVLGMSVVKALHTAMQDKNVPRATDAANQLHRHNRQTARLSKLFEEDVSDYHVDPDADYDENAPAKPVNTGEPIVCTKFLTKLQKMNTEMQRAINEGKARARPGTPKAPN